VETTWTGGTPPLTYAWNSGHQTAAAGQLPPGFYVLTVTDAVGCTAVYASAISTPEALELSVQQQNIPCFNGNNGELSVAPTGGTPPYQYAWSGGSTLPTLSNLPAGIYECVVTDHNGCTLQALRELIQPPQLAGVLAAIPVRCFGAADGQIQASAFGGTQPYRFSWSNSLTTSALVGLAPGNYGLTLTDANDCTAVLQASITEPPQLISTGSGSGVSCFAGDDGTATASASGGTPPYAYSWSNGSSGSQLSGISAGAYTATATDALGCQTLVSVGIGSPEPLQVAGELVPVRCHAGQDGGIALSVAGGSPPYTFLWENGDDLPFRQNLGGGDYLVAVTDAEGCREEQAFIIAEPPPLEADLGADVSISLGQQVELEVITNAAPAQLAQIRWLGEATDTTCAACVSIARLPRRSGCFEVQLLTTAGCRAGDAVCVVVRPDRYVFIPNVIQPDLDGVNDALTVYTDLSVRQVVTFQVFNRWGGLVFENRGFVPNQESMGWDGTLAGEPLQPGVYIWRAVIEFIDDTRTQLEGDVLLIR
jgi:gliding motility-associated-like protein